jgi:hypothetical protein
MKTVLIIIRYLLGIVLLITGSVTIKMEEGLYGLGILSLAILILPISSKLLTSLSPSLFSGKVKIDLCAHNWFGNYSYY